MRARFDGHASLFTDFPAPAPVSLQIKLVNDVQADAEWREFMAQRHAHAHAHTNAHTVTTVGTEAAATGGTVDVPVTVALNGEGHQHTLFDPMPVQGSTARVELAGNEGSDHSGASEVANPWGHAGQSHASVEAVPAPIAEVGSWATAPPIYHAGSALPVSSASKSEVESQEWR